MPAAMTKHRGRYYNRFLGVLGFGFLGLGFGVSNFYFLPFKDENAITCYVGRYRPPF